MVIGYPYFPRRQCAVKPTESAAIIYNVILYIIIDCRVNAFIYIYVVIIKNLTSLNVYHTNHNAIIIIDTIRRDILCLQLLDVIYYSST